jgi:putative CocE/NonD family hydrolase
MSGIKVESDVPVAMRDGTVLRADIYRPDTSEVFPSLVVRMPYNKSNPRYQAFFDTVRVAKAGYAVVIQDCRGTAASDGVFEPVTDEARDGFDTVEWVAVQPWCNGRVGMYGLSYHGLTQWAAASQRPPSLVAMVPGMSAPGMSLSAGGAFMLHPALWWSIFMSIFELPRRNLPAGELLKRRKALIHSFDHVEEEVLGLPLREVPCLQESRLLDIYLEWLAHTDDDAYWQEHTAAVFQNITIPALLFSGWYDLNLSGTLACHHGITTQGGSEQARQNARLVIGPWIHGVDLSQQAGELDFGLASSGSGIDFLGQQIRWFDHWLKGAENGVQNTAPVRIFVMGENAWRDEQEWPLTRSRYTKYYFHSNGEANTLHGNGTLSTESPLSETCDQYDYDPKHPVPSTGGMMLSLTAQAGAFDQQEIEKRSDVLVYTSAPLEVSLEVTGPITVTLYAASSVRDTDFTAKLVDVWPDGRAYILRDGIIRARSRTPGAPPSLIEPGRVYEYSLDLGATSNVFKPGHRIRIEVSSSNFPLYDRNSNTGNPIGADANLQAANQTIFHDENHPSHILLPLIRRP